MSAGDAAIMLDGNSLTLEQMGTIAGGAPVALAQEARRRVEQTRRCVEQIVARGDVVYGINTGFGALADVRIAPDELRQLQLNLLRSHACGVGEPLSAPVVRAMMAQRANVLAKGFSGCRPGVIKTLIALLNAGVHPVIPSRGSVGASGDLAPLAHLSLVLVGEGEADFQGERLPGGEALRRAGVTPLVLEAKEGLALLNGTQAMCAVGGLALLDAERLTNTADIAGALTLDALRGTPVAFDARIQAARPHPGQAISAARLRALIEGSAIRESHRDPEIDPRVQDAYSLRCMPQVHGAARDALAHVRQILEIEINSATDNPLVFADAGEVLSGGNFHGEPVALALDYAAIAVADLGTISERRVERLVNPTLSGLPAFLTPYPGTNSGLMMAQVTAAALIAENNVLVHPATVLSLPTSANREDHVSMGMTAALKFAQVVRNVETILAIELLCGAQALEFLKPLEPGPHLAEAYRRVREVAPPLEADTPLAGYIAALVPVVQELGEMKIMGS
ncbi:MAG TPA: histidine ammonia-lyase [Chthonomonadaceae bacterium]|nr:histidine ammonia-lyase [Chthonomonadaceae bacterium]